VINNYIVPQKSVACLIFYNLKKPDPKTILFDAQHPENPSFLKHL